MQFAHDVQPLMAGRVRTGQAGWVVGLVLPANKDHGRSGGERGRERL